VGIHGIVTKMDLVKSQL